MMINQSTVRRRWSRWSDYGIRRSSELSFWTLAERCCTMNVSKSYESQWNENIVDSIYLIGIRIRSILHRFLSRRVRVTAYGGAVNEWNTVLRRVPKSGITVATVVQSLLVSIPTRT